MREIGVVTVARSDYGIYKPVLDEIQDAPDLELRIIAAGMHLAPEHGRTIEAIEDDGFDVADRVHMNVSSDAPAGVAKSMGLGLSGFGQVLDRNTPDLLIVLGDRFEMFAAAAAALPFNVPLAHIHGGEVTEGAFDDALRHAITKMSHLHFVSTDEYRRRVVQLGEDPDRVIVSGAPSLDNIESVDLVPPKVLEDTYGLTLDDPPVVVTFHPVTREPKKAEQHVAALTSALGTVDRPIVVTAPNADPEGRLVRDRLEAFADDQPRTWIVDNLGTQHYFSLMNHAAAMVGNSSSGIIEAASFDLPVVDIGTRQAGRVRGDNVVDVGAEPEAVAKGIEKALDPSFQDVAREAENPYGDGDAAEAIVDRLRTVDLDDELVQKGFHDWRDR